MELSIECWRYPDLFQCHPIFSVIIARMKRGGKCLPRVRGMLHNQEQFRYSSLLALIFSSRKQRGEDTPTAIVRMYHAANFGLLRVETEQGKIADELLIFIVEKIVRFIGGTI